MRNFAIGIFAVLASCGPKPVSEPSADNLAGATAMSSVAAAARTALSPTDLVRVCKAGMSAATGAEPETMSTRTTDESVVQLSYTRDDGKAFAYDCLVEGNQIRTRMIDEAGPGTGPGAWSGRGSTATFDLKADRVVIDTTFFDGSSDSEEFKL